MTRARHPEAPDLHERFGEWLKAGAPGEPARDVAVHAAHCPGCRAMVDAWDRLALVDTGLAPMPPDRPAAPAPVRSLVPLRAAAVVAGAATVVAVGAWIGASGLGVPGIGQAPGSPTPDQQVLGGLGAGGNTPAPSESQGAPATGTPAATPSPDAGSETPGPSASPAGTPPPPIATARPATPPPPPVATARPTATPLPPSPPPTATPTPPPTATPAPTPTPDPTATPPPSVPPSAEPSVPASVEPSAPPG